MTIGVIKWLFPNKVGRLSARVILVTFLAVSSASLIAESKPVKVSGKESAKLLNEPHANAALGSLVRSMRLNAVVHFEFTVSSDGTVIDIVNLEHIPPPPSNFDIGDVRNYLVVPAKQALSAWTYRPYLVGGRPTSMRTTVEFKCDSGVGSVVFE